MKVCFVSDTHNYESLPLVDPCDLLIHCGDGTRTGSVDQVKELRAWLLMQPARHRIYVPGNHDELFAEDPVAARALMSHIEVLIDEPSAYTGLRIWGSPWTPAYGNYSFMTLTAAEAATKWQNIPYGLDLLITHGPPRYILDRNSNNINVGCEALATAVRLKTPRVHAFGHVHEDGCRLYRADYGTTHVNAAMLNACRPMELHTDQPITLDM